MAKSANAGAITKKSRDETFPHKNATQDTGIDKNDFIKTECTYNAENGVTPQNQQDLNVTITGTVAFQVLPRNLEFGFVQPGSQNNPATNGPIIFNITGSTADAQVEITEVFGFPFNQGLKIDGQPATGSFWIINYTSPIQIAFPTLDIPEDAQPKIYTKFFRADNARMIKTDGTGLGLYITKSIVEALNGSIEFKSTEGRGTTFFVTLSGRDRAK